MSSATVALDKGLPTNVDAERFVIGSILLDDSQFIQIAGTLEPGDFSLEKHRRMFKRMGELKDRGERIDRVTLANELLRYNELESCDGLTYLVSLDDGLPPIYNLDSYIRIVKDKSMLRRIIFASQQVMQRCLLAEDAPEEILAGAEETLLKLGESGARAGLANADKIIKEYTSDSTRWREYLFQRYVDIIIKESIYQLGKLETSLSPEDVDRCIDNVTTRIHDHAATDLNAFLFEEQFGLN